MIIGGKTTFAVEFYASLDAIPPFGQICYWVDGEAYGDIELISTLGLLLGGLNIGEQTTKLFLKKNIQQEGLDTEDLDDISLQIFDKKSVSGSYEYYGYPLTVEAAESFDSCHVFLLQDIQQNAWIIAEDFEEQRYCCINVNVDDIRSVFFNLSNRIHNLLELHYK
jgi:hypothetical protein